MNKLFKLLSGVLPVAVLMGCKAPPHFSPDGKSIAYSNGNALYIRSHRLVTRIDTERADEMSWSPDGRFLVWLTNDNSKKRGHQTTLSIADAQTRKTTHRELDANGTAWLNGHLLCTTSETSDLLTLDPHGLKTIEKRSAPAGAKLTSSSSSLKEAYLEYGKDQVKVYDGSRFFPAHNPPQTFPIETSGGEAVFVRIPQHTNGRVMVWRRTRSGFETAMMADLAEQFGPNGTVAGGIMGASISDDGQTVATMVETFDGTLAQRQQLVQLGGQLDAIRFGRAIGSSEPEQGQRQADELTKQMREGMGVLIYKRGHLKEWIPYGKKDGDMTLDPSGRRLAIETESGIRMVNLKP